MFLENLLKNVAIITLPNPDLLNLISPEHYHKCFVIPYAIKKAGKKSSEERACNYVYLGYMVPHKGIFQLISELADVGFKEELHIFGPPPSSEILSSLPAFVRHRGLIEDYDVLSDYKGLIVPSLWRETGPLVLQEGIRAGIPVFVRRGAVSEFYYYKGVYEFSAAAEILSTSASPGNDKLPDLHEVRQKFFNLYRELCFCAGRPSL
jgi:glycosyltransferase involved in cell wall biosynthesis